ncbi:hypothetical protein BC628DRAFT_166806 [Trametes gibbosa]|nr:hypothetical protein BC628DRAFT_166806 [Trametes gibbosa]
MGREKRTRWGTPVMREIVVVFFCCGCAVSVVHSCCPLARLPSLFSLSCCVCCRPPARSPSYVSHRIIPGRSRIMDVRYTIGTIGLQRIRLFIVALPSTPHRRRARHRRLNSDAGHLPPSSCARARAPPDASFQQFWSATAGPRRGASLFAFGDAPASLQRATSHETAPSPAAAFPSPKRRLISRAAWKASLDGARSCPGSD